MWWWVNNLVLFLKGFYFLFYFDEQKGVWPFCYAALWGDLLSDFCLSNDFCCNQFVTVKDSYI